VIGNGVFRRIFGPKRDKVRGDWIKSHTEELHNFYSSPNIFRMIKSRMMRWVGHVARMGEMRNSYKILVRKPEVNRLLGRPERRREDNIKMDVRERGLEVVDWIHLAQDRDDGGLL
jgi:hypothetical protein